MAGDSSATQCSGTQNVASTAVGAAGVVFAAALGLEEQVSVGIVLGVVVASWGMAIVQAPREQTPASAVRTLVVD